MDEYLLARYLQLPDGTLPHLGVRPGEVAPVALLCGSPGRVERISRRLDDNRSFGGDRGFPVFTGAYNGRPVSVASSGMGCPSVAVAVEELAQAGARTFLRLGSCASLHPAAPIGSLLLATAAVRDEGTSPYYAPASLPAVADHQLTQHLHETAGDLGLAHRLGVIRSTDSFYEGERKREIIDRWRRLGVLAFEMESAALFTVAAAFELRAATLLVPGSNLVTGTSTYRGDDLDAYRQGVDRMIELGLEAASRLPQVGEGA